MTKKSDAPAIRFKGFSDAWEQRKLGDMMNVTSVKRIHQSDWTDSGVRFLRARDIVAAAKNEEPDDYLYISKEKYEEYSTLSGKVGVSDLLVTGVGTIGVPYLVRNLEPLYFKDGNIIWFQNSDKIDGKFLFYSFSAEQIQGFINESAGIGTVGTYTIESGKKTPISLPNQIEQAKVGEFFQQLDNLITLHQRQPFLQSPPDISLIVQLTPPFYTFSWEQRKLGEVIRLNGRIGFRGYTEKDIVTKDDGGVLTFSPTNIVDNKLTTNCKNTYITRFKYDESPEIKIHNGDILFVKTGSTLGKSALVTGLSEDATLNPQVVVMRTNNLNVEFLAAMLVTNAIISQVNSAKIGGAIPTLTETRIKDFDVAIPVSEAEKEQIGQFFSQLDNLITLHQRQTIVYAVIRSIRKVILAERQYFAPPMVRKSP